MIKCARILDAQRPGHDALCYNKRTIDAILDLTPGPQLRTGTLHTASEIDAALSSVYNVEKIAPTVAGVGTNLRLWVSIAPVIFVILSFFFWYHVKRVARSDSAISEPWIFVDAAGYGEKIFAVLWGILLVSAPAPIIYAVLNRYEVALPRIPQILAWLGFSKDPLQQFIIRDATLSFPAAVGSIIIGTAFLLFILSIYCCEEDLCFIAVS